MANTTRKRNAAEIFQSRNFFDHIFEVKVNSTLHSSPQSVEKREIYSHRKTISSNQLFSNFFSKTNAFTQFLSKMCEREFP